MMSLMTAEGNLGLCVDMFSLGMLKLSAVTDGQPPFLMRKEQSTRDVGCKYCIWIEN